MPQIKLVIHGYRVWNSNCNSNSIGNRKGKVLGVYLNHAGTSWPKPAPVQAAAIEALNLDVTNWPEQFESSHHVIANWLGAKQERLLLTPGCTSALGIALQDWPSQPGDLVLTSSWEHHAMMRGLHQMKKLGVEIEAIPATSVGPIDLEIMESKLRGQNVSLVAVTAASNVTGDLLPIREIISVAHQFGVAVLIDGAQVAGWLDLDLQELQADLFTFAGHKGPQAYWGIGGLYIASSVAMNCLTSQCELPTPPPVSSQQVIPGSPTMRPFEIETTKPRDLPEEMPSYCDAGSVDRVALASLRAGVEWLQSPNQAERLFKARQNLKSIEDCLESLDHVKLHSLQPVELRVPTLAFTVEEKNSSSVATCLLENGFQLGAGLQCSPAGHQQLGTSEAGVVRISLGPESEAVDLTRLEKAILACR